MAISTVGGVVKIGRGVVKVIKGICEEDPEEITKGVIKITRGTGRLLIGAFTGNHYEGGEVQDEAQEEY